MNPPSVSWSECLEWAAVSDVGMRRANNQDSHDVVLASDLQQWQQRGHCFLVADGMGAHAAGELASKLAVDNIPHTYFKLAELTPAAAIEQSVREANTLIFTRGQDSADFHGMGTTLSTLVLLPQGALVAHVGDSRVYRLRDQTLDQLTFDHSLVWEMMAAGQVSPDAVPDFVPKNVITRSLGPQSHVQIDLEGPLPVVAGDAYLLCSDGLTGQVSDQELGAILASLAPSDAVQTLVDLANLRGGPDNITVIVIRVTGPPLAAKSAGRPRGASQAGRSASWSQVLRCAAAVALLSVATGLGMQLWGSLVGVSISLVVGLLAGGVALVASLRGRQSRTGRPPAHLGRGPHRSYACAVDQSLVDSFASLLDRLREDPAANRQAVDWDQFDGHLQRANEAGSAGHFETAMGEYAAALRLVMHQIDLSHATRRKASDDDADY